LCLELKNAKIIAYLFSNDWVQCSKRTDIVFAKLKLNLIITQA